MERNTGRSYVRAQDLVTTTDGTCPDGYIEVETTMLAPGLRDLLNLTRTKHEECNKYALRLCLSLASRFPAVEGFHPFPDLYGKLSQIDNMTCKLPFGFGSQS